MKTVYFLYKILFCSVSIMQIAEDDGHIKWAALDVPQDGMGGHSGNWVEADTAIDAVWALRR